METKGLTLEETDELFDGIMHSDGVFVGDGGNVLTKDTTVNETEVDEGKV